MPFSVAECSLEKGHGVLVNIDYLDFGIVVKLHAATGIAVPAGPLTHQHLEEV